MLPWLRPLPNLVLKVVFGLLLSEHKFRTNFKLLASMAAEINRGVAKLGCDKCGNSFTTPNSNSTHL